MKRTVRIALTLALAAAPLMADLSYKSETKIVGGAMAGAMKMAMKMSKQARESMNAATYIKGNRMATQTGDTVTVMDLDAETVTTIDHNKREYSVMTFAEYQQAMQRVMEKAQSKKNDVNVQYSVKIDDGKKQRDVYGYPAKLTVMALSVEGSDQKGNSGAMEMVNDLWLSTEVAGASEMTEFSRSLAEKLAGSGMMNMGMVAGIMQGQKGAAQAMEEFRANAAKMQGVPVLTVIRMAPAGSSNALMAEAGTLPEEKPETAESSAAPSVGSVLKGMGGFGGFGRKKKEEPKEQPQANSGGAGTLMEMAMKNYDFSTAPVSDSQFAVPSGYKQVESELKKQLR